MTDSVRPRKANVAPTRSTARRWSAPRLVARLGLLALVGLSLAGCNAAVWARGGWPAPVTVQGKRILKLWQGGLLAALLVGAFVLLLILFASFAYRKRSDELPRQVRYNLPIEIVYTVVPMVIVSILFYFTVIDENFEDNLSANPDVTIHVVGFQWDWQFNYEGQGLQITGRPGQDPTLTIPVGKTIQFVETSPDVVHSFWVIPFLFKRDVIPGRENRFEVTVTQTGWFQGKCTELCGVDHALMRFEVHAVTWPQYQTFLQQTKALAASGTNPMYTLVSSSSSSATGTGSGYGGAQ
ncbi:MAG TPA: cytochrome c oxidase subunit II [Mycobacteriales bacterium]|nr:cytochrome c oxidase subunit II [Mycobacteriales bacterium]